MEADREMSELVSWINPLAESTRSRLVAVMTAWLADPFGRSHTRCSNNDHKDWRY
ncbi:hypothetical protein K431DRAFT_283445 [Polychaeton citri CBS 116435]|uniref:PH domain-containing protein n=1 Tax=Polychaeton citri CBS 116435 TaxID=1314669 RepID=A0A9P4UQK2_9PEZI|nr:hypothetical protein K431DRAFT_283445 [Polychaeton citri CBS 116435]